MNFEAIGDQPKSYTVTTPIYSGPLDLLLQLIERAELDITKLSLALVTDQFLEYLQHIPNSSASEVSAFLVIASKLLQIKSEILLPQPLLREPGEEDPGESLTRQLKTYRVFKQLAEYLSLREEAGLRTYVRLAPIPYKRETVDFEGLTLADITSIARSALLNKEKKFDIDAIVSTPRLSIREKISRIAALLRRRRYATFWQLISNHDGRLDIVVTFLALLELVKREFIRTSQDELFGEIKIERNRTWAQDESFDLEFGE